MNPDALPHHPLANLFPLIEGDEFDALVASIKANGLRDAVVLRDGMVLDGRNRQRACSAAGVECRYHSLPSEVDAVQFVIDKNLKRRHLNDDQRRMVAARLATISRGRPSDNPAECGIKLGDAARMVNVDKAGTERARTVIAHAIVEVRAAVERGKLSVAAASQAAKLEKDQQRRIAAEAEAGRTNVVSLIVKQARRTTREHELGAKQKALPQKQYGVIVADPEWHDEVWSEHTGMDRHAGNHYPTSTADVIASRPVGSIAAPDCVLFLWSTNQHLRIAISVMEAWGFEYKSNYCWGKTHISLGRWQRGKHELLLIGTCGRPPCPAAGTQWDSLITASKGAHSAKPEIFLEMIEQYFPTLSKIELNRRGPARLGWDAWGDEAEQSDNGSASAPVITLAPIEPMDSLELPNFLRIGHPECSWRRQDEVR